MNKKVSVIIPCYNSEDSIEHVVEETVKYLKKMGLDWFEFILINDGSKDQTFQSISRLAKQYDYVKGIDLAKNCGQHNAILAGMHYVKGDYILGMDDDMQTHPSQIKKLFDKMEEGYDIIYGKYPTRHHSPFRNFGSKINDWTIRSLIGKPKGLKACSMYLLKRFVCEEIIKSPSAYTNLQGLYLRTTSKIANADIEHFDRESGTSGYTLRKLGRLWFSFMNYSVKPIRMVAVLGVSLFLAGILYLIATILWGLSGTNTLVAAGMLFTGVIVTSLGIIGEYIARMFEIMSCNPQYVIREKENIE